MDLLNEMLTPKIADIKEKKGKKKDFVETPILHKTGDKIEYSFILDNYPEPYKLIQIKTFIERNCTKDNFQIVYPLKIKAKKKDFTEGDTIVKFLRENKFDLNKIIPEWSKIFTFGRMLYLINDSNQMNLEGFYDTLLFRTNYFLPSYKCQVFPVESYDRSFFSNSFENYFAKIQFEIANEMEIKPRRIPKKNIIHIIDTSKFFKEHMDKELVVLDIETSGTDWLEDIIGSIQFAFDRNTGYFMEWKDVDVKELSNFLKGKKLIGHNFRFDTKFILNNGVDRESVNIYCDTLSMAQAINEMRLNNLKGLTGLYTDYYGYDKELEDFKEKFPHISYITMPFAMRLKYGAMDACINFEIFEKMLKEIRDMDREFPLKNGNSLEKFVFKEIMPTINTHLDAEMVGININIEELYHNAIFFHKKILEVKDDIRQAFHISDKSINVSSGKQMSEIVKKLGWKDQGLNNDGSYTMDGEALEKFVKDGHKEAQLIIDLHKLEILMNMFVGYPQFMNNEEIDIWDTLDSDESSEFVSFKMENFKFPSKLDMSKIKLGKGTGYWRYLKRVGRGQYKIFPNLGTCRAKSFRSRPSAPNTAQISSHGEYAKRIRKMITTPKEYVLSDADQSGLQLRNIAFLLEDGSPMRTAFIELGGDIHSMSGAKVINQNKIPIEEFIARKKETELADIRFKAKSLNFSACFGAAPFTIRSNTIEPNWSEEDCVSYITENKLDIVHGDIYYTVAVDILDKHFKQYWGLKNWIETTKRKAKRDGFVRSPYGSFRRTPYLLVDVKDAGRLDKKRYSNYESICLNSPIQTLEVVVMNRTLNNVMNYIKENNLKSKFIIAVHDAISMYVFTDEVEEVCTAIKYFAEMDYPEYNGIPLEMEGNIADVIGTYRNVKLKDGKEVDASEVWDMGHDWGKYINMELIKNMKSMY